MATRSDDTLSRLKRDDDHSIGSVVELVKTYAEQETVEPIKAAGRWVGVASAGALLLGVGLSFVMLGLLRMLQTEWPWAASGSWSWLPYVIVLVACIIVIVIAVWRINATTGTSTAARAGGKERI